jgi:hypothetical protein
LVLLEHDRMRLPSTAINMLVKTKSLSVHASLPEAMTLKHTSRALP